MKFIKWTLGMYILLAFFSCKPKTMICCHYESYTRPVSLVFVGYDSTELKTAVLRKFAPGSDFRQPIDSVLLADASIIYSGNTAYDRASYFAIGPNHDYTLSLSDSLLYTFTSKPNEEVKICVEMEGHCSPGSSQTIIFPIRELKVNGQKTTFSPHPGDNALPCIFIKK